MPASLPFEILERAREVAGPLGDDLGGHRVAVSDVGEVGDVLERLQLRERTLRRRDFTPRRIELLTEAFVLVLELVGAAEAVEPVGGRVDHVVGEGLHRRDDVLGGGARRVDEPRTLLVERDEGQRRQDQENEREPATTIVPIDDHGARAPLRDGQSWGEELRTCFSTSKFSRH